MKNHFLINSITLFLLLELIQTDPLVILPLESEFCFPNRFESCGKNALCYSDKCKCLLGFIPSSNQIDCIPDSCSKDFDCHNHTQTVCSKTTNTCQCNPIGYELDEMKVNCVGQLGTACEEYKDCGKNSICSKDKKCICHFGYEPNFNECKLFKCQKDEQCLRFSENTYCKLKKMPGSEEIESLGCDCKKIPDHYNVIFERYGKCIPLYYNLNESCNEHYDSANFSIGEPPRTSCSRNVYCLNGKCKCKFGFIPMSGTTSQCEEAICNATNGFNCKTLDPNAECLPKLSKCGCKEGFFVVDETQKCGKKEDPLAFRRGSGSGILPKFWLVLSLIGLILSLKIAEF